MSETSVFEPECKFPLVSIGVPTYGRPEGLRRLLGQLVSQTYRNIEIIVSDNCHPKLDGIEVAKSLSALDSRIVVYRQPHNLGPVLNHDFVKRVSRGDYFMWIGDDDEIAPNYIEECMKLLLRDESISLVGGVGHRYLEGKQWFDHLAYDTTGKNTRQRLDDISKYAFGEYWLFEHYFYGVFRKDRASECLSHYLKNILMHFFVLAESGQIVHAFQAVMIKHTTQREIDSHATYDGHHKVACLNWLRGKHHDNLHYSLPIYLKMSKVVFSSKRLALAEKLGLGKSITVRFLTGPILKEIKLYIPVLDPMLRFCRRAIGGIQRRLGLID